MKTKIVYSEYIPEDGMSVVTISNKFGEFTGISYLHEEDKHLESNFVGCRYAEIRAWIEYYKYRKGLVDAQLKGLSDFEKILKGTWNYNPKSSENNRLRKRMAELKAEKAEYKERIEVLKTTLRMSMDQRDEFVKKHLTDG